MPSLLEILLEPKTMQRGYFNPEGVRQRILEHRNGTRDRSCELWHLLVFELWHRNFLEPATRLRDSDGCRGLAIRSDSAAEPFLADPSAVAEVA